MFYLTPSTSGQVVYLTLREGRYFQESTFTDYLMVLTNEYTGEVFYLIPAVTTEAERYTAITIGTDANTPLTGHVLIPNTKAGYYSYTIYGQNSATNLDPEDADVVGVVERGKCVISSTTVFFEENVQVITADKAYAG